MRRISNDAAESVWRRHAVNSNPWIHHSLQMPLLAAQMGRHKHSSGVTLQSVETKGAHVYRQSAPQPELWTQPLPGQHL